MASVLLQPVLPNVARSGGSSEQLRDLWKLFSKVKDSMEHGRRFENLSWRLWFRSNSVRDTGALATYIDRIGLCHDVPTAISPLGAEEAISRNSPPPACACADSPPVVMAVQAPPPLVVCTVPAAVASSPATVSAFSDAATPSAAADPLPSPALLADPPSAAKPGKRACFFIADSESSSVSSSYGISVSNASSFLPLHGDARRTVTAAAAALADQALVTAHARPAIASTLHSPQVTSSSFNNRRSSRDALFEKVAPPVGAAQRSALSAMLHERPSRSRTSRPVPIAARRPAGALLEGTESLRMGLARERQPLFRYNLGCSTALEDSESDDRLIACAW